MKSARTRSKMSGSQEPRRPGSPTTYSRAGRRSAGPGPRPDLHQQQCRRTRTQRARPRSPRVAVRRIRPRWRARRRHLQPDRHNQAKTTSNHAAGSPTCCAPAPTSRHRNSTSRYPRNGGRRTSLQPQPDRRGARGRLLTGLCRLPCGDSPALALVAQASVPPKAARRLSSGAQFGSIEPHSD